MDACGGRVGGVVRLTELCSDMNEHVFAASFRSTSSDYCSGVCLFTFLFGQICGAHLRADRLFGGNARAVLFFSVFAPVCSAGCSASKRLDRFRGAL